MPRTDAALVAATLKGEKNAYAELVERYVDGVYKFAYRYLRNGADAEDIAQETFLRAWRNLKRFDQARAFKTWLFTIAKNASLDFLKKKRPVLFSQLGADESAMDLLPIFRDYATEVPEVAMDRVFLKEDLDRLLGDLPPAYRTVLTMRYRDNLKFREIAAALKEPVDTIKSRHRRGLALLKGFISTKTAARFV